MRAGDGWSPEAYGKFTEQRTAPFQDLLALLSPAPGGTLLDLGCGTGALTVLAHQRLQVSTTLGVDSSPAMLAQTPAHPGVTFERRDLEQSLPPGGFDRIISNSVWHWISDHETTLPRLMESVRPGGQLAVQFPSHEHTPFAACAIDTARRFHQELGGFIYRPPLLSCERYTELFARRAEVDVLKVGIWHYPQLHRSVDGLVEFAQGGHLSLYRARLAPETFERFCACYREALARAMGEGEVFFALKRIFLFASKR